MTDFDEPQTSAEFAGEAFKIVECQAFAAGADMALVRKTCFAFAEALDMIGATIVAKPVAERDDDPDLVALERFWSENQPPIPEATR